MLTAAALAVAVRAPVSPAVVTDPSDSSPVTTYVEVAAACARSCIPAGGGSSVARATAYSPTNRPGPDARTDGAASDVELPLTGELPPDPT